VLSTALGRALGGRPTVVWVGDIAFVHDSNALVAASARKVDLRIVVSDNGGGGIFSFLPQAKVLASERFEQLFGTPHATDIEALAGAHAIDATTVERTSDLVERVTTSGLSLTRIVTDRAANVKVHSELNGAVSAALD
jgi:2-succinyl-5-enolpyruvyl-6-hydroxy-3-cyclohexene-1-carboxylate synthase